MAGLVLSGTTASAAEVTLRMKGGDFSVTGDLKAFESNKYTIVSKSFGSMSLDAARFDCEGAGCPKPGVTFSAAPLSGASAGPVSIIGSNTIGGQLMPALVQAYAQSQGLKTTRVAGATPEEVVLKVVDAKGAEVGAVDLKRHGSGSAFKAGQPPSSAPL
jgi:phosphate transport system substrate-binding protein